MFKEVADIQTAETLNLPTPDYENINVVVKPSEMQQEMVQSLGERAEKIRNGGVDATKDNMLKITNEGRKLALDQRLMNPLLLLFMRQIQKLKRKNYLQKLEKGKLEFLWGLHQKWELVLMFKTN